MNLIQIRPPRTVEEYSAACALVAKIYQEAGYSPREGSLTHPRAVLVAVRGDALVGSVGVQSGDDDWTGTFYGGGHR